MLLRLLWPLCACCSTPSLLPFLESPSSQVGVCLRVYVNAVSMRCWCVVVVNDCLQHVTHLIVCIRQYVSDSDWISAYCKPFAWGRMSSQFLQILTSSPSLYIGGMSEEDASLALNAINRVEGTCAFVWVFSGVLFLSGKHYVVAHLLCRVWFLISCCKLVKWWSWYTLPCTTWYTCALSSLSIICRREDSVACFFICFTSK